MHDEHRAHLKEMGLPTEAIGNAGQGAPRRPLLAAENGLCSRRRRLHPAGQRHLLMLCSAATHPTRPAPAGGEDRRGVKESTARPASVKASLSVAFGQRAPNRAGVREQGRGMGSELQLDKDKGGGGGGADRRRSASPRRDERRERGGPDDSRDRRRDDRGGGGGDRRRDDRDYDRWARFVCRIYQRPRTAEQLNQAALLQCCLNSSSASALYPRPLPGGATIGTMIAGATTAATTGGWQSRPLRVQTACRLLSLHCTCPPDSFAHTHSAPASSLRRRDDRGGSGRRYDDRDYDRRRDERDDGRRRQDERERYDSRDRRRSRSRDRGYERRRSRSRSRDRQRSGSRDARDVFRCGRQPRP